MAFVFPLLLRITMSTDRAVKVKWIKSSQTGDFLDATLMS